MPAPGKPTFIKDSYSAFLPKTFSDEGPEVYTTTNFFLMLKRMSKMATVLGKKEDAVEFDKEADIVRDAIYKYCFDKEKEIFGGIKPSDYREGPNAMALHYGIVKPEDRKQVMENLLNDIWVSRDYHFYDGIFTGFALWKLLPENNKSELAFLCSNSNLKSCSK